MEQEPFTPRPATHVGGRLPTSPQGRSEGLRDAEAVSPIEKPTTPNSRYNFRPRIASAQESSPKDAFGNPSKGLRRGPERHSPTSMRRVSHPSRSNDALQKSSSTDNAGSPMEKRSAPARPRNALGPADIIDDLVADKICKWVPEAHPVTSTQEYLDLAKKGQKECLTFFDGFETTWHVPSSISARGRPHTAQEARELASASDELVEQRILNNLGKEVDEECEEMWGATTNAEGARYQEWARAREQFSGSDMVDMISRNRLFKGSAMLPEYFRASILDLSPSGRMVTAPEAVRVDVALATLISRLDHWDPADSTQNRRLLAIARDKLNCVTRFSMRDGDIKEARQMLKSLDGRFYQLDGGTSERRLWAFKLSASPQKSFRLPKGKNPAKASKWSHLKDATALAVLTKGARQGKLPVLVRKARLRRMWPRVDELLLRASSSEHQGDGDGELTREQLKLVDEMLSRQSESQRQEGRELAALMGWK